MGRFHVAQPVLEGYTKQIVTSPSSKVWHAAQETARCFTQGEAGQMPAYATRCGKEILVEIADRDIPIGSKVECSGCLTNRLYSERALVERAKKEIRAPKDVTRKFDTIGEASEYLAHLYEAESEIGLIEYLKLEAGKSYHETSKPRPTQDPTEWTVYVRYYTPEQAQMFAEERRLKAEAEVPA